MPNICNNFVDRRTHTLCVIIHSLPTNSSHPSLKKKKETIWKDVRERWPTRIYLPINKGSMCVCIVHKQSGRLTLKYVYALSPYAIASMLECELSHQTYRARRRKRAPPVPNKQNTPHEQAPIAMSLRCAAYQLLSTKIRRDADGFKAVAPPRKGCR